MPELATAREVVYVPTLMSGSASAFALIRVPRGAPQPSDAACRAAIARDRALLRLPAPNGDLDYGVAGPYAVIIDGTELDEYTVWEK